MASVLVTGAAGFVGSHLLDLLEEDGADVVGWLRPGTEPLNRGARTRWVTVEMQDRGAVAAAIADAKPSAVYHLAGVPHVGDSWGHTRETFAGNVLATHHLFDALRVNKLAPRVLITSSATIYAPSDRAIRESDPVNPNSPYGTSKLAQEMVAERFSEDDGIPAVIARAFNHIGPRQSPTFVAASIAKQIAEIEAGIKPPTMALGNVEARRDIMDVRDTVRAYRALIAHATPGTPYNVCTGKAIVIRELVDAFLRQSRVPIAIEQDPARMRPNDTPLLLGDPARITRDTGWRAELPLEATVEELLNYWRSRV